MDCVLCRFVYLFSRSLVHLLWNMCSGTQNISAWFVIAKCCIRNGCRRDYLGIIITDHAICSVGSFTARVSNNIKTLNSKENHIFICPKQTPDVNVHHLYGEWVGAIDNSARSNMTECIIVHDIPCGSLIKSLVSRKAPLIVQG